MPISEDEWKAGRSRETLEAQILTLLKQNPRLNISGIASGLGYNIQIKDLGSLIGGFASYWRIQNALDKLVEEGAVEARTIKQPVGEEIYYKANLEKA